MVEEWGIADHDNEKLKAFRSNVLSQAMQAQNSNLKGSHFQVSNQGGQVIEDYMQSVFEEEPGALEESKH